LGHFQQIFRGLLVAEGLRLLASAGKGLNANLAGRRLAVGVDEDGQARAREAIGQFGGQLVHGQDLGVTRGDQAAQFAGDGGGDGVVGAQCIAVGNHQRRQIKIE